MLDKNGTGILKIHNDVTDIDKSWFGDFNYYNLTGYNYVLYPSMSFYRNTNYIYNGQVLDENEFSKEFRFIDSLPGTGASVYIFQKN